MPTALDAALAGLKGLTILPAFPNNVVGVRVANGFTAVGIFL